MRIGLRIVHSHCTGMSRLVRSDQILLKHTKTKTHSFKGKRIFLKKTLKKDVLEIDVLRK